LAHLFRRVPAAVPVSPTSSRHIISGEHTMSTARPLVDSTLRVVGHTPVVKLRNLVPSGSATVLVKLEYFNPTGSYKDRMALAMIEEAEARGDLRPGMTVVEYTGGSTGSSLAFVCAVKGYRFHVVSSDAFSPEKLRTMRAFGAQLEILPSEGGKITPDLIPRLIARVAELKDQPGYYATDQFRNHDSLKGYAQIGHELLDQVDGPIHAFCGGVGTAGMLMGAASVLKAASPATHIVALEPATSAVISTGKPGAHHIEGVGVGFVPPLLDTALYDEVRGIDETEARALALRLARAEGIFSGISAGMNVAGALQLAQELGPAHTVVTVASDSGLKYLTGDLYAD
jgi:cysteine synthase A